jgi:hypothetical protein
LTVSAPRIGVLTMAEINRAFAELAKAVTVEARATAIGEWRFLEVLSAETSPTFFPTTRRIYSVPSGGQPTTQQIRVFNTGETIVRHSLGRKPFGRAVLGQPQSSILFDLDVSTLSPALDPAEYVAFRSSASGLFTIAVVG